MRRSVFSTVTSLSTLWLAALLLLPAIPLDAAEPHAILARGFEPGQVYDFNGIDHVNALNGNLIVTIPIGQRYPVNGGFEYGFTLVYNSQVWEYVHDCPGDGKDDLGDGTPLELTNPHMAGCIRGIPNPKSNAGTGWRLSLGELYDQDSPLVTRRGWIFVDSSGAEHRLIGPGDAPADGNPWFSQDGTYLRLRATTASQTEACLGVDGTCMAVDHSNGVVYAFERAPNLAGWRLRRIQDRFGNGVEITYSSGQWVVEDTLGRRHTIDFDLDGMVSQVILAAFGDLPGSATAAYQFTISDSPSTIPGCPHDFRFDNGDTTHEILSWLTSVSRPDGSSFTFTYAEEPDAGGCTHSAGRVETLTLPTGGAITYEYGGYQYPVHGSPTACDLPQPRDGGEPRPLTSVTGVTRRLARNMAGDILGETLYLSGGLFTLPRYVQDGDHSVCVVPPTTFTEVYEKSDQGRYKLNRHFFDVTSAFLYGLPSDETSPDPKFAGRFRSSMVFDCAEPTPVLDEEALQEDWVAICNSTHETGCWQADEAHLWIPPACNGGSPFNSPEEVQGLRDRYLEHESDGATGDNRRVKSERTYFYDTPGHYYVETVRRDFDGFGHYRKTVTDSNSPRSVERTVTLDYRPEVTDQRWILGLFDEKIVEEPGKESRETYQFNRATGFLETKTSHRSSGNLVADFEPDLHGNVFQETYSGGDTGRSYVIRNEFQYGTLSKSEYLEGGQPLLRTVDADIDPNTGLPAASRDQSGLQTSYTFDALGRLTAIAQEGTLAEAPTSYTYQKADPDPDQPARARVTITRGDTESVILFDALGRVNEQKTRLPDGSFNRRFTTFTPMGQPKKVTTVHAAAAFQSANKTETVYDVFGRPTHVIRPDNGASPAGGESKTVMWYEGIFKTFRAIRYVQTETGPEELLTRYERDHQGRLVRVEEVERDGSETTLRSSTNYHYDEGGRLIRVGQGIGESRQVRTFQYDEAGLLTRECHPELAGGCILYSLFDARGNPGRLRYDRADGDPFELDYTYDGAERFTQVRSPGDAGEQGRLLKEFFYTDLYHRSFSPAEGNGKLHQAKRHNYLGGQDIVATTTHTYGGIGGRLSSRTVSTGGDGDVPRVRFTTGFVYDSLGNLRDVTYPGCDQVGCEGEAPARTIRNAYTRGLLTGVGTPGNASRYAALSYHPNLTLSQVTHGNGVLDEIAQDPSQMPRPGGIEVKTGAGTLWKATYAYDGAGNLVSRLSQGFNNAGTPLFDGTDIFRYDNAFNRLLSATIHYPPGSAGGQETRNYAYDPFGNLTSISGSNPRNLFPDPDTNRLQSPFTYDGAGNLTSQPAWEGADPTGPTAWYYTYDPFNMLTRTQNAGGSVQREYLYTADGERLAVLSPSRELWTIRGADNKVLRDVEYLSTGWRWVEDYIHGGPGLLATIGDVTGERHHHLDHLGSPRLVTDMAQQVKARHVQAPYGEELTSSNQDELRMKFTGHERDELDSFGSAGDLDYMHARYCSPQTARFLSVDPKRRAQPLKSPQLWNRYAYTAGNPLKFFDPDGRDLVLAGKSKALRKFLVRSLQRPTFRQAATAIANDRTFTVTVRDARITPAAEVAIAKRQGRSVLVTFGDTAPVIEVVDGEVRRTGANVRIDTAMVSREHPDSTGVVTTAHEIAGHANDFREGASAAEIESTHAEVEQLGFDVLKEAPDITQEEAEGLLQELLKPPPE